MIGIEIESQKAEVAQETSIGITLINPLFNSDNVIPGDYSLPFDLPGPDESHSNAAIFNHADVIEAQGTFRKKASRLYFDNVLFKSGNIVLQKIAKKLNANFTFGLSTISNDFKNLKLRDLMNENIVIDNSDIVKKIYIKILHVASSYTIIVNGNPYTDATLAGLAGLINANSAAAADTGEIVAIARIEASVPTPLGSAAPYLVLNPGIYYHALGFLLHQDSVDPLAPLSVKVSDNGAAPNYILSIEADLGNYYSNFQTFLAGYLSGAYPTDKIRFPVTFNDNIFQDRANPVKVTPFVNGSEDGGIMENLPNASFISLLQTQSGNSLAPYVRLRYILDKAASYFGFTYEGDWITDPDTQAMLIDHANPLDVAQDFIGEKQFVFWKRSFNLKDLVPDMTFVDFLKAFQNRYNLGISWSDKVKKIRVIKRESLAESTDIEDISNLAGPVTSIQDQTITGIRLESAKESEDLHSTIDQYNVGTVDQTSEVIHTDIAPLQAEAIQGGFRGIMKSEKQNNSFELRIFYYKGIVNNGTFNYPQALKDASAYIESYRDGFFTGVGIYNALWKKWIRQRLKRKAIEIPVNYELRHLIGLNMEQKKRFDRNDYFIYSVDFNITNKRIEPSKVILFRA